MNIGMVVFGSLVTIMSIMFLLLVGITLTKVFTETFFNSEPHELVERFLASRVDLKKEKK